MATRIILTYDDLAALPSDGKRHESLEGELYVTPSPRTRHQLAVGTFTSSSPGTCDGLASGEVFLSPTDVILTNITVVVPDLVYVDAARLAQVSERAIEGPPTLAIEVLSPSTAAVDRGIKRQLAARYGVRHYWLVDADARLIETYNLVARSSSRAAARGHGPGDAPAVSRTPARSRRTSGAEAIASRPSRGANRAGSLCRPCGLVTPPARSSGVSAGARRARDSDRRTRRASA